MAGQRTWRRVTDGAPGDGPRDRARRQGRRGTRARPHRRVPRPAIRSRRRARGHDRRAPPGGPDHRTGLPAHTTPTDPGRRPPDLRRRRGAGKDQRGARRLLRTRRSRITPPYADRLERQRLRPHAARSGHCATRCAPDRSRGRDHRPRVARPYRRRSRSRLRDPPHRHGNPRRVDRSRGRRRRRPGAEVVGRRRARAGRHQRVRVPDRGVRRGPRTGHDGRVDCPPASDGAVGGGPRPPRTLGRHGRHEHDGVHARVRQFREIRAPRRSPHLLAIRRDR